jgi:hypothetical protein
METMYTVVHAKRRGNLFSNHQHTVWIRLYPNENIVKALNRNRIKLGHVKRIMTGWKSVRDSNRITIAR